jgi:hypothetical protein
VVLFRPSQDTSGQVLATKLALSKPLNTLLTYIYIHIYGVGLMDDHEDQDQEQPFFPDVEGEEE